jgi:hypothetical protein
MSLGYSEAQKEHLEIDTKVEDIQQEYASDEKPGVAVPTIVPVSNYANLTPNETMRKFWRLYCAGIATSIGAV